jgi:3-(3-hydroxy-phenyl)propionate hydroxylase
VFFEDRQVYSFDLLPEPATRCPAMINLQQYYREQYWSMPATGDLIDLRWKHKVLSIHQDQTQPC